MAVYGNVNVKYAPCKSAAQLHSAADYILGKKKEQLSSGVIKTKSELYNAFGCNRDNFANSVLMTRKMHQKENVQQEYLYRRNELWKSRRTINLQ